MKRYVKLFRSNTEAAEQFITDEKFVANEARMRGMKKKVGVSNTSSKRQNLVEPRRVCSVRKPFRNLS